MRRGLALGVGLLVLLLLVLGAKGCLDARKNRSLETYANSVSQLTTETNNLGKSFVERLASPGGLSVTEFTGEIESDRGAMEGFTNRVERLGTPGDMSAAQDSLQLVYRLRADAMRQIADRMSTALGDEGRERAIRQIASNIESLNAADVIFNRITRPAIEETLTGAGAGPVEVPRSTFLTEPARWIDPAGIESALNTVAGGTIEADDDAVHGTGIISVSINGTALDADVLNTVTSEGDPTVEVEIQNQGEVDESGIKVTVTVGSTTLQGTLPTLAAGASDVVSIPVTPAPPAGEVQLDVKVDAVPGEQMLDNNEASYTVSFG